MARRNIPILVIPNNPPNQLVNIPIPQRLIINEIVSDFIGILLKTPFLLKLICLIKKLFQGLPRE